MTSVLPPVHPRSYLDLAELAWLFSLASATPCSQTRLHSCYRLSQFNQCHGLNICKHQRWEMAGGVVRLGAVLRREARICAHLSNCCRAAATGVGQIWHEMRRACRTIGGSMSSFSPCTTCSHMCTLLFFCALFCITSVYA